MVMSRSKLVFTLLLIIYVIVVFMIYCTTVKAVEYELTYYFEDNFKYANDAGASANRYIYR